MVELTEIVRSPWEEGYDARFKDGLPLNACPYASGWKKDSWVSGWSVAHDEH